MQTEERIAELERELAAAKAQAPAPAQPSEPDTSQMPGGVDGAPVSASEPEPHEPASTPVAEPPKMGVIEDIGIDIIQDLKAGRSVSDVANMLLSETGLHSIVKAIGQLAKEVGL